MTSTHVSFLFDASQTRRLLDAAAALPDNSRARQRGPAYCAICALWYGLGLRAGEACGLRLRGIDTDRCLVVVRGGKFGRAASSCTGAHRRARRRAGRAPPGLRYGGWA